jgi:hypothetical protein
MMSVCAIGVEGAASLRFLQGRVTMLTTQFLSLYNPVAHAFQVPALCKVRKGRGTHYVFGASEVKSLGHPALSSEVNSSTEGGPLANPGRGTMDLA